MGGMRTPGSTRVDDGDSVDGIVRDWSAARPDLDMSPLGVFSRVKRIAKQLDGVRKRSFATAELELWEFDVLASLRRADVDVPLTPKQLLSANLVSSGTMTNRIDRLVARGLVTREADPVDGRSVRVRITREGIRRVDTAIAALVEAEAALLRGIDESERETMADGLRRLALRLDPAPPADE